MVAFVSTHLEHVASRPGSCKGVCRPFCLVALRLA